MCLNKIVKHISLFCALVLSLIGCASYYKTVVYFEDLEEPPSAIVKEGYISSTKEKVLYVRSGETIASIVLSDPVVVAQAEQEEKWGYFQFPSIGRADDGTLIVGWSMSEDSHKSYGKIPSRTTGPMMSKDNGRTWSPRDKDYHELRGVNKLRLRDGRILRIITPESKDLSNYNNFPQSVGKRGDMSFYPVEKLPEELKGVYIHDGKETVHAKLIDPDAVRFAIDNLMPIQWWGNIKELANSTLVAGVYPCYYLIDKDSISPSYVCFFESNDGGREWKRIGKIPFNQNLQISSNSWINKTGDYEEPAFEILADSTYLCIMRTGMVSPMLESFSYDRGRTWTVPNSISPNGVDPSLLLLKNGVLVLVSGRPGIQIRFSLDGTGRNWTEPLDMMPFMKEDGSYEMNVSCGYPSIIEADKTSFYLVYSDFMTKNEQGEYRKSIIFRRITVEKM